MLKNLHSCPSGMFITARDDLSRPEQLIELSADTILVALPNPHNIFFLKILAPASRTKWARVGTATEQLPRKHLNESFKTRPAGR